MIQLFIVNKDGRANLKDYLLREPENRSKKRGANNDKWEAWRRRLLDYEVVNTGSDIKGKEIEGELFNGMVHIHRIIGIMLLFFFPLYGFSQLHYVKHVYHTERLMVIQDNLTVSGTVEKVIREKDGDVHIRLKLDSCSNLLNNKNITAQHGCLVLEIICACKVTQADAVTACKGYINVIPIPLPGQHIVAQGDYALDRQHGWMEMHPLTGLWIE